MPARERTARRPESSERYLGSDRYTKGCSYSAGRRDEAKKILVPDGRRPRHSRHSHVPYQAWVTPRQLAAANEAHLGLRLQSSAGLMSAGQKQARQASSRPVIKLPPSSSSSGLGATVAVLRHACRGSCLSSYTTTDAMLVLVLLMEILVSVCWRSWSCIRTKTHGRPREARPKLLRRSRFIRCSTRAFCSDGSQPRCPSKPSRPAARHHHEVEIANDGKGRET